MSRLQWVTKFRTQQRSWYLLIYLFIYIVREIPIIVIIIIDTAVPVTHNLPKTEAQEIAKYGILALEIKNIWKLNDVSLYPTVIWAEGVATKSFLKYLQNIGLTKNILRVAQKAVLLQTCHTVLKFLRHAPWPQWVGWISFPWLSLIPPTIWERWRFSSI